MSKNDGGPASPHSFTDESIGDCSGMSLRDYFAAKIMQGIVSNSDIDTCDDRAIYYIKESYKIADEMLKARKEQNKKEGNK